MKKFLIFALIAFFGVNNIQAKKTNTIEAEGNLESPNPCGCVEL